MASTLIIGGSGKCARHITRMLVADGQTVYSLIRNPSQVPEIEALGGRAVVQSIEDSTVEQLTATMRNTRAGTVVWAAGAGGGDPGRTAAVDRDGAIKALDAAAAAEREDGVNRRYLVISALDVRDRDRAGGGTEPEWYDDRDRDRSERVWGAIRPYMEAKFAADRELVAGNARRKLRYTIVRPGGLTNDPGKGTVDAGKVHLSNQISREDVARVVVECIKQKDTEGLVFDVVGGETPIADAVAKVAKEKVDTFAGRY